MEKTHEEWHCRKCGELIDAPTIAVASVCVIQSSAAAASNDGSSSIANWCILNISQMGLHQLEEHGS